ncbi:MAG: hypothetical protein ACEPO8_14600 [Rhodothermaceae bacterium]
MKEEIVKHIEAISPAKKTKSEREKGFQFLRSVEVNELQEFIPNLIEYLQSKNSFSKYASLYLLRDIILQNNKDVYINVKNILFAQLLFDKPMIIMHTALVLGEIAGKYSEESEEITEELLSLENKSKLPQKDLVMGYIIEAFGCYYKTYIKQSDMIEFIERHTKSGSPKTKKLAKEFLESA